jgi:hydrogenase nickel incorporation protein HypA/HybF
MHEASVAEEILGVVHRTLAEHPGCRVVRVRVSVGALAHLDADALRFAFDILKEGTPSAAADLDIERENLEGRCGACEAVFEAEAPDLACPACGGREVSWKGEHGTQVLSLDVDDASAESAAG